MSLKKNVVTNYLGQAWSAIMGLAFIPLYISYLGMEAYGLIGLFALTQVWLTLLDMGMTPTLNREMARFTAGAHSPQSIRDLLRSVEIVCFTLAGLIALGLWGASGYLATHWLKPERLSTEVVTLAIAIMALIVALRFCEGIYRSSLFGLQRQVWYNGANSLLATVRHGGAVAVLAWVSPTIEAFFIWQAAISLLTVLVLAMRVHEALPATASRGRFSRRALAGIWGFASGMMAITVLGLLLTQADKVLLSRLLPLELFGYYTLAATVAGALYMLIVPITQAVYPQMVEMSVRDDRADLAAVYHQGAQLVTVLTAPAAMILGFFAGGVVFMWSGDARLADNTAPILSALVLGNFLHGLMHLPYQLQLAQGWTSLTIKTNIIAVIAFIPAILITVPRYGAVGAAWIWLALNACYVLIVIQLMHRKLMPAEKFRWYFGDVALPAGAALAVVLLAQQVQPTGYQSRVHWLAFLAMAGFLALVASTAAASLTRNRLLRMVRSRTSGPAINRHDSEITVP
ncbi:MAG: oligosaccharide flippase family protein [Gemmatimonadaceae bacterium]